MLIVAFCPPPTKLIFRDKRDQLGNTKEVRRYRGQFLVCFLSVFAAPFVPVTFGANVVGDVLTSFTSPLKDLAFTACFVSISGARLAEDFVERQWDWYVHDENTFRGHWSSEKGQNGDNGFSRFSLENAVQQDGTFLIHDEPGIHILPGDTQVHLEIEGPANATQDPVKQDPDSKMSDNKIVPWGY